MLVPASAGPQRFSIVGSKFRSGAQVSWEDLTAGDSGQNAADSISANRILVSLTVGGESGNWGPRVRKPDGQASGWVNFQVVAQQATFLKQAALVAEVPL